MRTLAVVFVVVLFTIAIVVVAAARQLQFLKRTQNELPSGRELHGSGFNVRLWIDYHLLAAVPLDQQHAMTDLASGHTIDREVAEERAAAEVGKCLANLHRVEALCVFDRG